MRRFTLALLFAGYALLFVPLPWMDRSNHGFDPLDARGREVERAIEARDFSGALPLALELNGAYPDDPVVAYWLTEIYLGIGSEADAASAWQRYKTITGRPDEEGHP